MKILHEIEPKEYVTKWGHTVKRRRVVVRCHCGEERVVFKASLKRIKSCGCLPPKSTARDYSGRTLREWSELTGIKYHTLDYRLRTGDTIEEAVAKGGGRRCQSSFSA